MQSIEKGRQSETIKHFASYMNGEQVCKIFYKYSTSVHKEYLNFESIIQIQR